MFINPTPVTIDLEDSFRVVDQYKVKYGISSFLVTGGKQSVIDSPRVGPKNKRKPLVGILTNRDINCSESEDDKVKSFMTPIEKMIVYEVPSEF